MCPGTPSAAYGFVDTLGCPLDNDSDGVYDYLDLCPQTLPEARAHVDEHGCDLDSDGDGVPDYRDLCPGTPVEARGFVDANGCELDTDSDGVYDWKDQCPGTPVEARGFVDSVGCELDSDGDSVPDWKDLCPNTPAAARGFVDSVGCELDDDADGVPNWKDECPTMAGPAYNKGCPEVKKEIRNLLKKAMQGIQFETGKAVIKPVSFPLLNQIAAQFIENKNFIIEVQGHTDNVGKADYNLKLSDARANSVMNYLVKQGVPQERISAKGYGMDVPIADNKTKAGRAKNRRVEFAITFEEVKTEIELQHIDSALYKQHLQELEQKRLDSIRQDSIKNAQAQPAPQQADAPQTVQTPAGEAVKQ
jgi:outer membrane protein OmpA-like peptidoglycan-associated protein